MVVVVADVAAVAVVGGGLDVAFAVVVAAVDPVDAGGGDGGARPTF